MTKPDVYCQRHTFSKNERLCSTRLISMLFDKGGKVIVFPYKARYYVVPNKTLPSPCQTLISVSKRNFRHAVDRNRVKRLTREVLRINKQQLYSSLDDKQLLLSISYIHNQIFEYNLLNIKMQKLVALLQKKIKEQQ